MQIHTSSKNQSPYLTIVACQHGNETFGLEIIKALKPRLSEFPGLQLVVANDEAIANNTRGIDGDLNRSYPGDPNGNHEARTAYNLLKTVGDSRFLLDVHTSVSSCGFLVPIVTKINDDIKRLINLTNQKRVICVEKPLSDKSLIGNVSAGMSLEFQKSLADNTAVDLVIDLVEDMYDFKQLPRQEREIYCVTDVLNKELKLPESACDFELIEELNLYPVLLKDPNYMGNQGLKATRKEIHQI